MRSSLSQSRLSLFCFVLFFCVLFCHQLLSAGQERTLQNAEFHIKDELKIRAITAGGETWALASNWHTFIGFQARRHFSDSRAPFVNRVKFLSTSPLAPLCFVSSCVCFCFGICFFCVLFVFFNLSRTHHDYTKFSHSVHHEGKRHGYYSHVGNWYSMSLAIILNTRKKNQNFETMKWQLVTTVFLFPRFFTHHWKLQSFKLHLNFW